MMTPDIEQGISVELKHILLPDWKIRVDQDGFILTPPKTDPANSQNLQLLSQEAWRIAQFVAYANFCSIEHSSEGSITIASHMASGNGFKIIIEVN
jgi:hypothetical protein